ncbi:MAG: hypothetical protein V3T31_12440, partial [candidate division Zixibacteria bacterium]
MVMDSESQVAGPGGGSQSESPDSIWSIMGNVFLAPSKAFESYNLKPSFVVPLILGVILMSLITVLTAEQAAQDQYDMMKNSTVIPADGLAEMKADISNPNLVVKALSGLMFPVMTFIQALFVMFLGNVIFGGRANLMKIWGAVM